MWSPSPFYSPEQQRNPPRWLYGTSLSSSLLQCVFHPWMRRLCVYVLLSQRRRERLISMGPMVNDLCRGLPHINTRLFVGSPLFFCLLLSFHIYQNGALLCRLFTLFSLFLLNNIASVIVSDSPSPPSAGAKCFQRFSIRRLITSHSATWLS